MIQWDSENGVATAALFNQPLGICTDKLGNIYVADTYNNAIRMISTTGVVTTIGGKGTDSAGYRNGQILWRSLIYLLVLL